MSVVSVSIELAGRTLTLEVGRLAAQATSAVLAKYGESVVLATVVLGKEDLKKDYFPLSVEYQERLYAGGRIKGSRWVKREGRPTDAEVLAGRLIDRSIRPLFPKSFRREVQVIITVLSTDIDNDTDVLGAIAASAALAISPIPWGGPIGSVRIGQEEGKLVVNPKNGNRSGVDLDLVVSSLSAPAEDLIDMIEAGAHQVPEDIMLSGLQLGLDTNRQIITLIEDLVSKVGQPKLPLSQSPVSPDTLSQIREKISPDIKNFIAGAATKEGGDLGPIISQVAELLETEQKSLAPVIVEDFVREDIRSGILKDAHRPDGRKFEEIRALDLSVSILPRVHGSAIFQRGQTQALVVTTLGAPSLSQSLETAEGEEQKRFMLHYNFPPYSTGETGRMGSPGRREIGHGALAEKGLAPVIPPESEFPYAIRVVSEIASSNGSSSMASTCGATLSLMDAGVPISAPVAGISTGLVTPDNYPQSTTDYALLTDIIGMEDHYGDMDFKVAGTKDGITSIQLDVKVSGLTMDICRATFARAKKARMQILDAMQKIIPAPRKQLSAYAPQISTITIPVDKIGELIGPGGKVIKRLMADTDTVIDVRDDGSVFISGTDQEGVKKALTWISGLGKEAVPGEVYEGTVARLQPFGAFVNILPGKDGLVHVSQMGSGFVSDPASVVKEGDVVKVWVTEIDSQGRINLSMLFDSEGKPVVKAREERPRSSSPHDPGMGHFRGPRPARSRDPRRR